MNKQGPEFIIQRISVLAGVLAMVPGVWLMQYLYDNRSDLGEVAIFAICLIPPLGAWGLVQAVGNQILKRRSQG